jgi:hypothetical protein
MPLYGMDITTPTNATMEDIAVVTWAMAAI